jgi:hypothetical protein
VAISDTSICNSALAKLGADRIIDLNEDNKRARLCKEQYPKLRDDLLRSHPWNFAIARKELAESATYTPPYEFEHAFPLPSDCLRVLDNDLNFPIGVGENVWAVEVDHLTSQRMLVCNSSTVIIKYVKSVSESFFSNDFAELLAMLLARDLCYALTQSSTLLSQLDESYKQKIREVRSFDAQEGSVNQVQAVDWHLSRN